MQPAVRSLTREPFKGWPAYALRQDALCLCVVPAVGGRLMGIRLDGQELCFVHPDLQGQSFSGDEAAWPALCGDWDFPLWGGGKTWVAPESAWPQGAPHRDLDSLAWNVTDVWCTDDSMGVEVQSPVCRSSGLQIRRRLHLGAQSQAWSVEHSLRNRGDQPQACGIWDVLMLERPAVVSLALSAQPAAPVCALPGKPTLAELEGDGTLQRTGSLVRVHCLRGHAFKCGFWGEAGRLQVDRADLGLRYTRHAAVDPARVYAHGHPLEVFNAPTLNYFEVETHSPLAQLQPGDCLQHTIHESVERLPCAPRIHTPHSFAN